MRNRIFLLLLLITTAWSKASEPEVLMIDKAVSMTLAHNYDILISKNQVKQAQNNASVLNRGVLPTVSVSAGASAQQLHNKLESSGTTTTRDSNVQPIRASADVSYTLFNGYRIHNIHKLKATYNLSKLELRQLIESIILQLYEAYYEIFFLQKQLNHVKQKKAVSKDQFNKASIAFDYGSIDELTFLNAQIDFNNDSIAVTDANNQLVNAKRNLNLLMGVPVGNEFRVDTTFKFQPIPDLNTLLEKAKNQNVTVLLSDQQSKVFEHKQKRLTASLRMPTISLQGSYDYTGNNYIASIGATQQSRNLTANLTLSYNIFSGGGTRIQRRNAKLDLKNQDIRKKQTMSTIEKTVRNVYESYKNQQRIMKIEELNVLKNKKGFKRTWMQFKIGVIPRIEYRSSLENLFNAKQTLTEAMYKLKVLEIQLLQLSAGLVNLD